MKYYFITTFRAKFKKSGILCIGEDVKQQHILYVATRSVNWFTNYWKIIWHYLV